MEIMENGSYYEQLSKYSHFEECLCYVKYDDLAEAYKLAGKYGGNQMPRDLTLYIIYELQEDPLYYMSYVPENYLYECDDAHLAVSVYKKEIKDNAFCYCSIGLLYISKDVEKIGDHALRLNKGQIVYQGTKQEFIDKFLGKSCCCSGTSGQVIQCADGDIIISKQ